MKRFAVVLALLASGCHGLSPPSRVALWEIDDGHGAAGYLLGTMHALPPGTRWDRPAIDRALAASHQLVLEVAQPLDASAVEPVLKRLGHAQGLPPPLERVSPQARDRLQTLEDRLGMDDSHFAQTKTWLVAVELAAAAGDQGGLEPSEGVEPQLRDKHGARPVTGLETLEGQLTVFDQLSQRDQTTLLEQVAGDAALDIDSDRSLFGAWMNGNAAAIAQAARHGFLADPGLYEALLAGRNRTWAGKIDTMLRTGAHPFIAVGAAHCAGPDGLVRLLLARGWHVRRVDE